MQQYQQVPTSPPNGAAFIQANLPTQPPFTVPLPNVHPNFAQYVPVFTGAAIMALQAHAQKNELRSYYYNLCSNNGWSSNEFFELVGAIYDYVEFLVFTNQVRTDNLVQVIAQAGDEMTGLLTCLIAQNNASVFQTQFHPTLVQDVNQKLGRLQQLQQAIGQYRNGQMRGAQASPFGAVNPGMMQQGTPFGAQPATNQNYSHLTTGNVGGVGHVGGHPGMMAARPAAVQPFSTMWNSGSTPGFGNNAVSDGSSRMGRDWGNANAAPAMEEVNMAPGNAAPEVRYEVPKSMNELAGGFKPGGFKPASVQTEPQDFTEPAGPQWFVVRTAAEQGLKWPKTRNPDREWDHMLLEDGSEIKPAAESGWRATFDPRRPYPKTYDRTTHILFHVRQADGTVLELIHRRDETMEYLDHELDPKLAKSAAAADPNRPQPGVAWGLIEKLKPMERREVAVLPEVVKSIQAKDEAIQTTDVAIAMEDEVPQHTNLQGAHLAAVARIRSEEGATDANLESFEFYFDNVVLFGEEEGAPVALLELAKARTFEELLNDLNLGFVREAVSESLWSKIDERLTQALNEVLETNMSLPGWRIDSFWDDYNELAQELEKTYGKQAIAALEENASVVIETSLGTLQGDDLIRYIKQSGLESQVATLVDRLVVFAERQSVTVVPWKLQDIHYRFDTAALIDQELTPALHKAATSIMDRTLDLPRAWARRYIMTADRKLLELRQGYLVADAVLIVRR